MPEKSFKPSFRIQEKNDLPQDNKKFKISKEKINELPLEYFQGKIELIATRKEAGCVIPLLESKEILGFDTESKPSFVKGESNPIAMIQLSTEDRAFLFRVNRIGMPDGLRKILEDRRITKIVHGAQQEIKNLYEQHQVEGVGFIDLHSIARSLLCSPQSVRGLTAIFLGIRISKTAQVSNWENQRLTRKQILYAATDAWACRQVYMEIRKRKLIHS